MSLSSAINDAMTRIANYIRDSVSPRLLPSGGSAGQILTKINATDYNTTWTTGPTSGQLVPTGGSTGQVLSKSSAANGATAWTTPVTLPGTTINTDSGAAQIPSSGTPLRVIVGTIVCTFDSGGNTSFGWPTAFPTKCYSCTVINGDSGTQPNAVLSTVSGWPKNSGMGVAARLSTSGAVITGNIRINYIAIGY